MTELVAAVAAGAASALAIGNEVTKATAMSLPKESNYKMNLDKNYKDLNDAAGVLRSTKGRLLAEINRDKTKRPTTKFKIWILNANKIVEGVQTLKEKYNEEKRRQSSILKPSEFIKNVVKKHKKSLKPSELSKCMVEKHDEIQRLLADVPNEILVDKLPTAAVKNETPKIEDKPSLYRVFQQVIKFLADKDIKRVGLWGTVGIGKTAIMRNLNESKELAKMFGTIIFATVTEVRNVPKLQQEIAQQLGLNVEGITCMRTVALRISKELECKRYLLLLDDVWGEFELSEIGIDNGHDGKIVMASRYPLTCRYIDADEIIHVNRLSDDDALKLFQESLGHKIYSMFKPMAYQIIRECDNLPLLIDRVARTFRQTLRQTKEDAKLWRMQLNKLKVYPKTNDQAMDEVFGLLRFCFEELDDEDERSCFLYVALFPENCDICTDRLLECWSAEGLINDVEEFTARDRGQEILLHLVNLSLLESNEEVEHIRINKVIRKMALKIVDEELNCWVIVGKELIDASEAKEWISSQWISLMDNKLCILPEKPLCNNLSTLLLQRNADLIVIPKSFFKFMENLQVLDLHSTGISALPSSISYLKSLRALYLNSCEQLMKLPSEIKVLQHLEILDIRGSGVNALPREIGCLRRLRSLRISFVKFDEKLKVEIYCKVIQELLLLEELVIDVLPENQQWNKIVKGIAEGAAALTKLTHFSCTIGQFQSSCRYKFPDYRIYEIRKCLKYANGDGKDCSIAEVLSETNAFDFELIGHKDSLALSDFGVNGINNMRSCLVESCNEIKTVVNGEGITEPVLGCLEQMYLCNVPKLESIWEGPLQAGSLAKLAILVIFKCSNLKKIFPSSLVQHLSQLEHLELEACYAIEEITTESDNSELASNVLPVLKMLILTDLPILRSVCLGHLPLLTRKIDKCPLLDSTQ